MEAWIHKGGIAFASEKSPKNPVIVKFKDKPSEDIRISLKSLGLKWNSLRGEWEGYTNLSEIKELIAPHNATLEELGAAPEE